MFPGGVHVPWIVTTIEVVVKFVFFKINDDVGLAGIVWACGLMLIDYRLLLWRMVVGRLILYILNCCGGMAAIVKA